MSIRYAQVMEQEGRLVIIRHAIDAVGNNLTAKLCWCVTHVEPVWVFNDGSYECPHERAVGWAPDGHAIIEWPFMVTASDEV